MIKMIFIYHMVKFGELPLLGNGLLNNLSVSIITTIFSHIEHALPHPNQLLEIGMYVLSEKIQ